MAQKNNDEVLDNLILELRRGSIVLGVLSQLKKPEYGYNLITNLSEKGFSIDAGTLYPLLRRLEKQSLLDSSWDTTESRPRKYYVISPYGRKVYKELTKEWNELAKGIELFLKEGEDENETGR